MKAGGPFEMIVNDIRLKNILVGDVWLCSGQSNMELTVGRVTDKFAEEIARDENPMIRYVKIPLGNDLHGPKDDLPGTDWMSLTEETAPSFSALAYFFAKEMYRETQVPVGIVNSSWGGSSVEAWMSEEALQKFPRQLHERDLFNSDEYRELCNRSGQMMNRFWDAALYKGDQGLHDGICWNRPELDDTDWQTVDTFSKEWGRKNGYPVSGSHWFRQKVNVSAEQAGKEAVLRLGCMVDAASVFVNGIFVGNTFYQYPPRIYRVPASILKPGENLVTVRLINYGGAASFVPDKPYCLVWGTDTVHLSSRWKYQLGCEMPARTNSVSFQNIPTGMYNSMISPLRNLVFTGALWYQGETNTGRPNEYEELLTAMIADWREKLADKELPFFIVQLANFMQTHPHPVESNWAALREAQRRVALKVPNAALAVAIDLGEWNDIHPLNKKELAKYGGEAHCFMAEEEVAKIAKERGVTRAAVSMEKAAQIEKPVIFTIGNAPTALIELYEMIQSGKYRPAFIIGVPVGFVNVEAAKDLILKTDVPYIINRGRKGGSNIAAAICNALLYELRDKN